MGFGSSKPEQPQILVATKLNPSEKTTTTAPPPPVITPVYVRTTLLGQGTSGKVYECIDTATKKTYAMKIVTLQSKTRADAVIEIQNLKNEIALLKKLNHVNIVKYYNFDISKDQSCVEIVLEKVTPGTLKDLVIKKPLTEAETSKMTQQILEALKYLHGQGIIHRDLKGANILVNEEGVVKLSDFGTAKIVNKSAAHDDIGQKCKSLKGTPYWMAPEVLKRTGHTFSADIWSLGCTVIEMLTGRPPWSSISNKFQEIIQYIASGIQPPLPPKISYLCQRFLHCCLDTNPTKRLSAVQLLNHPFIKQLSPQGQLLNESIEEIDISDMISSSNPFIEQKKEKKLTHKKMDQNTQRISTEASDIKIPTPQPLKNNRASTTKKKSSVVQPIPKQETQPVSVKVFGMIDTQLSRKQREDQERKAKHKENERRQKARLWEEELKRQAQLRLETGNKRRI